MRLPGKIIPYATNLAPLRPCLFKTSKFSLSIISVCKILQAAICYGFALIVFIRYRYQISILNYMCALLKVYFLAHAVQYF